MGRPRLRSPPPSGKLNPELLAESPCRQLAGAPCTAGPNIGGIQHGASRARCQERPDRGTFSSRTRVGEGQPRTVCRTDPVSVKDAGVSGRRVAGEARGSPTSSFGAYEKSEGRLRTRSYTCQKLDRPQRVNYSQEYPRVKELPSGSRLQI